MSVKITTELGEAIHAITPDADAGKEDLFSLVQTQPQFGIVGVYDGVEARVGNVVVDSSFHHLFDINLTGDPAVVPPSFPDNPKSRGFQYDAGDYQNWPLPIGPQALTNVEDFVLNVAVYLAPEDVKSLLFAAAVHQVLDWQPLNIMPVHMAEPGPFSYHIGQLAHGVLHKRLFTRSQLTMLMAATFPLDSERAQIHMPAGGGAYQRWGNLPRQLVVSLLGNSVVRAAKHRKQNEGGRLPRPQVYLRDLRDRLRESVDTGFEVFSKIMGRSPTMG